MEGYQGHKVPYDFDVIPTMDANGTDLFLMTIRSASTNVPEPSSSATGMSLLPGMALDRWNKDSYNMRCDTKEEIRDILVCALNDSEQFRLRNAYKKRYPHA